MDWLTGIFPGLPGSVSVYAALLVLLNGVALLVMAFDKHRAVRNGQRVPELTLLLLAVLGGSAGTLIGMVLCKHKTGKVKFYYGVPFCYLLNQVQHVLVLRYLLSV